MLMAEGIVSSQLNDLLIQIGRSLLQYVGECWPWASSHDSETRSTLEQLAAEQQESVAALAELLTACGQYIDFGTYPTSYTSLHYVDVQYLLSQLVKNQEEIVRECDSVSGAVGSDPTAGSLVKEVAVAERRHLDELRKLAGR